jgi:hypothetical protein
MKRITINAYQYGLVFKNGVYQHILKEGRYWLFSNKTAEVYEITKPFAPALDLHILLKDAELTEALHVVEVKDNHIALMYENGLLPRILTTGQHAFWKGTKEYAFVDADISKVEIPEVFDRATLQHPLVAGYIRTAFVEAYEKGVLFVDGKYARTLDSGFYCWWKNNGVLLDQLRRLFSPPK